VHDLWMESETRGALIHQYLPPLGFRRNSKLCSTSRSVEKALQEFAPKKVHVQITTNKLNFTRLI
jgi:hypothetical protein